MGPIFFVDVYIWSRIWCNLSHTRCSTESENVQRASNVHNLCWMKWETVSGSKQCTSCSQIFSWFKHISHSHYFKEPNGILIVCIDVNSSNVWGTRDFHCFNLQLYSYHKSLAKRNHPYMQSYELIEHATHSCLPSRFNLYWNFKWLAWVTMELSPYAQEIYGEKLRYKY